MPLFYISFAMTKARGGFRGATIVEAPNAEMAVPAATLRGLNPGGEAAILPWPAQASLEHPGDFEMMFNRLASKEEMMASGAKRTADLPKKERAQFDDWALRVCSCCNPPRLH